MADQKQKIMKVVFGDPHAGAVRVMMGQEEIPNIVSVKVETTKPGELPVIDIKMLAPNLSVEDHTSGDIEEMQEVPFEPRQKAKMPDVKPPSGLKATPKNKK